MFALIAASPASALTHGAATRIALRILRPQRIPGPVVVFSLPVPLRRGGLVYEAGPPPVPRIEPLARRAYLYWEDLSHGAFFAHSSRLVLIDAQSGKLIRSENMNWFLIVNNRLAAFLRTTEGYEGSRYVVYSALPRTAARRARAAAWRAHETRYAAEGHPTPRTRLLAHDCMIPIGDFTDPLFKGGGKAMLTFASRIGLKTIEPEVPTAKGLAKAVDKATAAGCNDVFIYLAGHGMPPNEAAFPPGAMKQWFNVSKAVMVNAANPGGPAGVMTNPAFVNRGGQVIDESSYVTPADLVAIAKEHEADEFKIEIDSCFADRFAPVFEDTDNVRVLATSSSFNEVSAGAYVKGNEYFTVDPVTHRVTGKRKDTIDNPEGAGGFTNGNVHGLYEWAAYSSPTEDLVQGLAESYGLGMPFNESVQLGYTTPHLRTRPARATPPPIALPIIGATASWSYYSSEEIALHFSFVLQEQIGLPPLAFEADASPTLEAVKVVIPSASSGPRMIVNTLCPPQLPTATVSSTSNPSDTLTCTGGSLPVGQTFTLNVQTSPAPTAGMGGQLYGQEDGSSLGPFAIAGP
jgi:hypothetical protein